MAKGNNGNYLQHSLEVGIARFLLQLGGGRIHLALCHGMAPWEPCDEPRRGQSRLLLLEALAQAQQPAQPGEPTIIEAYRATNASLAHYPNTAELIASISRRDRISGGIAETDPAKHAALAAAWHRWDLVPVNASWRSQLAPGGTLAPPASLDRPWLFSMDPMTFGRVDGQDDDRLYEADRSRISKVLRLYASQGVAGVATIFVYAMQPEIRHRFYEFAHHISEEARTPLQTFWVPHQGGNWNVAAVLLSRIALPTSWLPPGVNEGGYQT